MLRCCQFHVCCYNPVFFAPALLSGLRPMPGRCNLPLHPSVMLYQWVSPQCSNPPCCTGVLFCATLLGKGPVCFNVTSLPSTRSATAMCPCALLSCSTISRHIRSPCCLEAPGAAPYPLLALSMDVPVCTSSDLTSCTQPWMDGHLAVFQSRRLLILLSCSTDLAQQVFLLHGLASLTCHPQ